MKVLKSIIEFIKDIFKKEEKKLLETPKENEKEKFIQSLKVTTKKKKKIETLICKGDGLGIQGKISG